MTYILCFINKGQMTLSLFPPADAAPTSVKLLFFVKTPPPPPPCFMYANYFVAAV